MRVEDSNQNRVFAAALLDPSLPVPEGVKGSANKRYAVYRNNVTVSLVRAMEANFPAVRKLLGEVYFAGLAREFAQAHPPRSPLMFFYGDAFASYLTLQDDLADYPYLSDVARLEQQWRLSYHAQDAACLAPEAIALLNDNELSALRLIPHPALALLSSRYAAGSIFLANRSTKGPQVTAIDMPEYVVVSRPLLDVETRVISEANFIFLDTLRRGESLGAAAEAALVVDADLNLAESISTMLVSGAFLPFNSKDKS